MTLDADRHTDVDRYMLVEASPLPESPRLYALTSFGEDVSWNSDFAGEPNVVQVITGRRTEDAPYRLTTLGRWEESESSSLRALVDMRSIP